MATLSPPPLDSAVAQNDGKASPTWGRWLQLLRDAFVTQSQFPALRYTKSSAQTYTNGAFVVINYETESFDSHNAVANPSTAWTFSTPRGHAGVYFVRASTLMAGLSGVSGDQRIYARRTRSGVTADFGLDIQATTFGSWQQVHGISLVDLQEGDTLTIVVFQSSGADRACQADVNFNHVDIARMT